MPVAPGAAGCPRMHKPRCRAAVRCAAFAAVIAAIALVAPFAMKGLNRFKAAED